MTIIYRMMLFVGVTVLLMPIVLASEDPNASHAQSELHAEYGMGDFSDDLELDAISLYELEIPTVITASRYEERLDAVPHAMSVITAEEIRASGALSVADALRLIPGMDVATLGLNYHAISPRGLHGYLSNQTLVLIDGRQIYDALFGGTLWQGWNIQIDSIDRIEVIRGPAGATWGTNAINGVINIITKQPAEGEQLDFTQRAGSRGFHREHLSYSYRDEKLSLRISGEYEANEGAVRGGSFLSPVDDDFWSARGSFSMTYLPNERDRIQLMGGHTSGQSGQRTPVALIDPTTPYTRSSYLNFKWTRQSDRDSELSLTAFVNEFGASNGVRSIDYNYQQIALQFSHTSLASERHRLTWGVDTRWDLFDSSNSDPRMGDMDYIRSGIFSIYIEDEWTISEKWRLDLGGRLDYETYFGFEWSGRGALRYQIDDNSSVFAAISRAYQATPAGARFISAPIAAGLVTLTLDQDVVPTTLFAYELGYRARPSKQLDLTLAAFWNEYDNLATSGLGSPPPFLIPLKIRTNAEASVFGVEAEARYKFSPKLTFLGNYTYQDLYWRSSSPFVDTDWMRPPRHKFMTGVLYSPTDDLHLSSFLYFTDRTTGPNPSGLNQFEIDEYYRLDLRAEYEFWEDRAAIAIGVHNLLDNHHYEGSSTYINNAEVPRMIFAELRITLR